ncbi:FHA domain-containing protein [Methylolobus aquaticus]|nr:FHA domain-containing protein [Methylolobus aquaticus]
MNVLAILEVQFAWGGSDEHALTQPVTHIGRAADNDVILNDPQVSLHHAKLSFLGGQAWLMDLGSLHGVTVNGHLTLPRTSVMLDPDAEFQIDEFTFRLRSPVQEDLPPVSERVSLGSMPVPGLVAKVDGRLLKFSLDSHTVSIGSTPDNDIVIPCPRVAPHHAEVHLSGDRYVIAAREGAPSLLVSGGEVREHVFEHGDTVGLGDPSVALQFRASLGFIAVSGGATPGEAIEIDLKGQDLIAVGRAPDNQIVLDHPQVSLHHALLERRGSRYRIRDLKSTGGVFVGGKRIEDEAWLREGDEIRIGGIRLILHEDGLEEYWQEGLRLDARHLNKWVSVEDNLLQDISLCICPQEFVALVGMSGAGKSTLMDAVNGFRPATHGQVSVNGIDLYANFDLFRNDMGYVPQRDIVHQELTVYRALDYAAQLRMAPDTAPAERHARIREVLDDLDLTERQDMPIHQLSGGQIKRVSIGVELLTKPRLFFLDEPTSGLDPGTEHEMMKLLRKLADQGRTILLSTHATKNVMMCDKVIFLARGGHLAYFGPPEEALPYFDQFRSARERRREDIEFDHIYGILSDEARGTPEAWSQRYRDSRQYRENIVERLNGQASPVAAAGERPKLHRYAGTFRQFLVLSARNLDIMRQDRFGLGLMLLLAPVIGLMDFIWGSTLFDPERGDPTKIITVLFMAGLIAVMVGAMASVREIVKEVDIYKRERAINLKVTSYVLSKVWVGVCLSLYQAAVLLACKWFFVLSSSGLSPPDYAGLFLTLFLGTLSGYLIGLCISAAAPNQNVAILLVVVVLVPQFLFAGALLPLDLIPGGEKISAGATSRWAFEAMVNITGVGRDLVKDPCWKAVQRNRQHPSDLTEEQRAQCACMGARIFDECRFPGVRDPDYYDQTMYQVLVRGKPREPAAPVVPAEPPRPAKPRGLPARPTPADQQRYQRDMQNYQDRMDRYEKRMTDYRNGIDDKTDSYKAAMKDYAARMEDWQKARTKVAAVEGMMESVYDKYGQAFRGRPEGRWLAMTAIMVVVFGLILVFQKRKDTV